MLLYAIFAVILAFYVPLLLYQALIDRDFRPAPDRPAPDLTEAERTRRGPIYCDGPDAWQPGWGFCATCGASIAPPAPPAPPARRSRWFCKTRGTACRNEWLRNHQWPAARKAALKRDRHCVRCPAWQSPPIGELQVNHIIPRNGGGYRTGCHNHQDNLESLCRRHHAEVTAEQRRTMAGTR